jgi:hypothetical protein
LDPIYQVLEGAEATIARDRPIIYIEVWQETEKEKEKDKLSSKEKPGVPTMSVVSAVRQSNRPSDRTAFTTEHNAFNADHTAFNRLEQWAQDHSYLIDRLTANDYRLSPLTSSAACAVAAKSAETGAMDDGARQEGQQTAGGTLDRLP